MLPKGATPMSPTQAWIALIVSGLVDVAWALAMKKADGFADPQWSAISLVLLALFVVLLTKALQVLPVGTAYAVWTGIGAAGTVLAGIVLLGEPASALRLLFIATVVAGIVGLKLTA
jgi:quaternary ammonium compound-resistance protein SugE